MTNNLTEQFIMEIQRNCEDMNQLQHGEVVLKVQDGRLVLINIKKSIKPKKEPQAPNGWTVK
ncbi:hypothetical protein JCM14036_02970 [Desulfotomaculum defluvii]